MQRFVVLFIFVFPFLNCVNDFIWFGESVSTFFANLCPSLFDEMAVEKFEIILPQ